MRWLQEGVLVAALAALASPLSADPCGMVPPIHITGLVPIERIGLQKTYVFYRDGMETFVIRPGYRGRVDNFGMLIPFPTPPAIRKVPDEIFSHIAAAVDPPEVVVDLRPVRRSRARLGRVPLASAPGAEKELEYDAVRVLRQEAVGMYEVAVLEAGSASALKRWMDEHGYRYPDGMDRACQEYVEISWCFVAVKTRVGQKAGVDPRPGQRSVESKLPPGSSFDGNVQAMGFRFEVEELVVPMRLSAFNEGELRNVVYVLTERPQKINHIPESHVVRQLSGAELFRNVTEPLPLRVIGGEYEDVPESRRARLKAQRDPAPHNGLARALFAADLLAVRADRLSHPFEEEEKNLLRVSERLGLRGPEVDELHRKELEEARERAVGRALEDLKGMSLTVIDGDFPRDVLSRENLTFAPFTMDREKNRPESYDAKLFGPGPKESGKVYRAGLLGDLDPRWLGLLAAGVLLGWIGCRWLGRRRKTAKALAALATVALLLPSVTQATPRARDSVVDGLIERLGDPDRAATATEALVALGEEAIEPLFGEALEGRDLARRGWALVCLAEIGGESVDRRLIAIHGDPRQPKLVRTWAAAARVALAKSSAELMELANLVPELPALGRPIGKRLVALLATEDSVSPAEHLIQLSLRIPKLQATLAQPILAAGSESLVTAMARAKDQQVRRQAAAYLATLAGQGKDRLAEVAAATVKVYRFDVEARAVPWQGGPLFVPGIAWPPKEARALSDGLMRWFLFSERRGLQAEKRQLHNNLRSLGLARAAGYQSPGWQEVGIEQWLRVWRKAFGVSHLKEILEEQRVLKESRYLDILEGL